MQTIHYAFFVKCFHFGPEKQNTPCTTTEVRRRYDMPDEGHVFVNHHRRVMVDFRVENKGLHDDPALIQDKGL